MSEIFTPYKLGPIELRNRTIRSAAFEGMGRNNGPTEELFNYHRAVAKGGIGMTTVAYAAVCRSGISFDSQLWMREEIVPELKRLTEEGLIRYSVVTQGERVEKKLYEITDAGKEDFIQWLLQDPPLDPTPKDVFRLRSYYSQWLTEKDYLRLLEKQIEKRVQKCNYLKCVKQEL